MAQKGASYGLNGKFVPRGESLLRAFYELGWLRSVIFRERRRGSTNYYGFELDKERIDVIGFSGDYVENQLENGKEGFFEHTRQLMINERRPVVITTDAKQEERLNRALKRRHSNIVVVRLTGRAAEQWEANLADNLFFDFAAMATMPVSKIINNNRHLIEALEKA